MVSGRIMELCAKACTKMLHIIYSTNGKLSFNLHHYICLRTITQAINEDLFNESLVGKSTYVLFRTNLLEDKLPKQLVLWSGIASTIGWHMADYILRIFAITGEAWSEEVFDDLVMDAFVSEVQQYCDIQEQENLNIILWSLHQGERLRVKYHTLPDFILAFSRGELYETNIDYHNP